MNCACWDLCGGRPVMGVPTAIPRRHGLQAGGQIHEPNSVEKLDT